jgi:hypothetical protein
LTGLRERETRLARGTHRYLRINRWGLEHQSVLM